ncbi:MAG: NAD(P)-binding domain-containing protein [Hyphomicrobiaceae bacterium]|nr:NAD(P)-binding domain-containing protein [Hyphomicrobiaceae bacterium]
MPSTSSSKRYCLIGAGACGLAIVKNFKEREIPFDCFESEADIGGIWNPDSPNRVYEAICLNTSKRLTRYRGFPIPDEYPEFMSRRQAVDYLHAYADHFGLRETITFNTTVKKVERSGDQWRVSICGEEKPRLYDGLVVSTGHHWKPKMPEYPGTFTGETLHSIDVKNRDQLRNKRVLIVGAGNTGCDLAADAVFLSESVLHSMRRSYYFLPKFVFGRPLDRILDLTQRWPAPRKFLRWLYSLGYYVLVGPHEKLRLPRPDHKILESHPSSAAAWLVQQAQGRITVKPDIEKFDGKTVVFTDGSAADVDLVVYATGFHATFPFMDNSYFVNPDGSSPMFLNAFHREYDNLFAGGLVQPADGSFWQLADYQGQLIATFVIAQACDPEKAAWFREKKASVRPSVDHGVAYIDSERHKLEVQHYRYRTYIKKLVASFGILAHARYPEATKGPIPEQDGNEAAAMPQPHPAKSRQRELAGA